MAGFASRLNDLSAGDAERLYSPAKYGYIKELIGKERLTAANAVVQAVTIVAILSGIFIFSVLFEQGLAGVAYRSEPELLQAIAPWAGCWWPAPLTEFLLT